MTEEVKQEQVVEKAPEQKQEEPQYTEIQLKAIDQGWIPKEEFDGDPEAFIDAAEFVRRGELFEKIEKQSKQLKAVREALEAFRIHHSKVKENEYQRALKNLQDARKEAMLGGDTERALALEEKIDEVKAEKQQIVDEAKEPIVKDEDDSYNPQFQSWVDRNPWYETNRVMRKTADALGLDLHQAGHSPEEVLKLVEREIRKEFPHKFTGAGNARRPAAVEASTRGTGKNRDDVELTSEEAEMMRKIVAVTPGFTEEQYKKELKALKGRG